MLAAIRHTLRNGLIYKNILDTHLATIDEERTTTRLVTRLESLGTSIELKAAA